MVYPNSTIFLLLLTYMSIKQCCGTAQVSMRFRIRHFFIVDPDPEFWRSKILKSYSWKKLKNFLYQKLQSTYPWMTCKLQNPSALKRERPQLQNMKFFYSFSYFLGKLCPPGSYSSRPNSTRTHADPDPKHWKHG